MYIFFFMENIFENRKYYFHITLKLIDYYTFTMLILCYNEAKTIHTDKRWWIIQSVYCAPVWLFRECFINNIVRYLSINGTVQHTFWFVQLYATAQIEITALVFFHIFSFLFVFHFVEKLMENACDKRFLLIFQAKRSASDENWI